MTNNAMGRTAAEIRQERLNSDPAFRERWERTGLARAVAHALIRYRAGKGWTQTQLAQQLGMRQPQVARLEAGERNPTFDTLQRISQMLGLRFLVEFTPPSYDVSSSGDRGGEAAFDTEDATSLGRVLVSSHPRAT